MQVLGPLSITVIPELSLLLCVGFTCDIYGKFTLLLVKNWWIKPSEKNGIFVWDTNPSNQTVSDNLITIWLVDTTWDNLISSKEFLVRTY